MSKLEEKMIGPEEDMSGPEEEMSEDYEDRLQRGPLPVVTPPGERAGMLPGIAGIGIFMLLVAMIGAFGAARGVYQGSARYVVLCVSTMIIVGVLGMLRLRRWGWALVIAGCLLMSLGYFYTARVTHNPGLLIMAGFALVFFLYLSRTEVQERMR